MSFERAKVERRCLVCCFVPDDNQRCVGVNIGRATTGAYWIYLILIAAAVALVVVAAVLTVSRMVLIARMICAEKLFH